MTDPLRPAIEAHGGARRLPHPPGRDWLEIITRRTLAAFSAAFSIDPVLLASLVQMSILGVGRIRLFHLPYDQLVTFAGDLAVRLAHPTTGD